MIRLEDENSPRTIYNCHSKYYLLAMAMLPENEVDTGLTTGKMPVIDRTIKIRDLRY